MTARDKLEDYLTVWNIEHEASLYKNEVEIYSFNEVIDIIQSYHEAQLKKILPSEFEIESRILRFPYTIHVDDGQYNDGVIYGFDMGCTWFKQQMLNK